MNPGAAIGEPSNLGSVMSDLAASMQASHEPWRPGLQAVRDTIGARVASREAGAAAVWRDMSLTMRELLCSLYTDSRNPELWAQQSWESFSDSERAAMGAAAREWRRQLEGAGRLR